MTNPNQLDLDGRPIGLLFVVTIAEKFSTETGTDESRQSDKTKRVETETRTYRRRAEDRRAALIEAIERHVDVAKGSDWTIKVGPGA